MRSSQHCVAGIVGSGQSCATSRHAAVCVSPLKFARPQVCVKIALVIVGGGLLLYAVPSESQALLYKPQRPITSPAAKSPSDESVEDSTDTDSSKP